MLEIPITPIADYNEFTQTTQLDGQSFFMQFSWSPFVGRWYLDLYAIGPDQSLYPVIKGASLLVGFPILLGNVNANRPKGELYLQVRVDTAADYAKSDLGQDYYVEYLTAAELGR